MQKKFTRHQIPIKYFINDMDQNVFTFPDWQREDCWKLEFKRELIRSIFNGDDLPKLYIGHISGTSIKYIVDGGHRSRTIQEFMQNKFSFKLRNVDIYYNKEFINTTRNHRSLSDSEKEHFDNYSLDFSIYTGISHEECRHLFNRLQNAVPMSIEDVINSHQSQLVDLMRNLTKMKYEDSTLLDTLIQMNYLKIKTKTQAMVQLISWFTIMFPMLIGDDCDKEREAVSLRYLTKGNNKDSPCLKYVKRFEGEITDEIKNHFVNEIKHIITTQSEFNYVPTNLNSYIHARVNYPQFNKNKYDNFIKLCDKYSELKKSAFDLDNRKLYDQAKKTHTEADQMDSDYNSNLSEWLKSMRNGGNAPSGMNKRLAIIRERCFN